jgi:hypothetical protein
MGALETSWFQAVWFAADGAVGGPLNAAKIGQPPMRGGFAAAAGAAAIPIATSAIKAPSGPTDVPILPPLMLRLSTPGGQSPDVVERAAHNLRSVSRERPLSMRDRFAVWLVTGPVGRFVAFVADLAVALARGAINKVVRR